MQTQTPPRHSCRQLQTAGNDLLFDTDNVGSHGDDEKSGNVRAGMGGGRIPERDHDGNG